MKARIISKIIAIISISVLPLMGCAQENNALSQKHTKITRQFSNVRHISPENFSKIPQADTIIFDVREPSEYDVSHISGAYHIAPNISSERFIEAYSDKAQGKTAIFYCSVGQRSSRLAEAVQAQLLKDGTMAVYNLEGGLFKWHNENRPLLSTSDKITPYIHPYNGYWGRMVNDQSKLRYTVDPN